MKRMSEFAAGIVLAALMLLPSAGRAQYPALPLFPGQVLGPVAPLDSPLLANTQIQFQAPLPVPVDLTPDKTTYPGWDYYEIAYAEVTGTVPFSSLAAPAGTQWLGLVDPVSRLPVYTPVWGYGQVNMGGGPLIQLPGLAPAGATFAATYPSMNIRASQGTPVKVKWVNNLPDTHLFCPQPQNVNWPCAIDRTLMGTKGDLGVTAFGGYQQPDNAVVVHLHGGEIPPEADGFAELWFGNVNSAAAYTPIDPLTGLRTPQPIDPPLELASLPGVPLALTRPIGNAVLYNYPNVQEAGTLWFHDHALGKTRINVAAGPAGFYMLNSAAEAWPAGTGLPGWPYEINIAIQDRSFNAPQPLDPLGPNIARINFPNTLNQLQVAPTLFQTPLTPSPNTDPLKADLGHPQWIPEYFGDISIVNGMAWPFLNVEPRKYRFRLLDGSNARCWALQIADAVTGLILPITQIGTDGGYLPAPVVLQKLTLCPGERADVVVDFTGLAVGTTLLVQNNAPAPFPKGVAPKQKDVGRVMQFRVVAANPAAPPDLPLPAVLNPAFVRIVPPLGTTAREMVLNEQLDPLTLFPMKVQIDGKSFEAPITETPASGTMETWSFINTTGDAHPIHLHLVQFQVLSRQKFDAGKYSAVTGFGIPGITQLCPPGAPVPVPLTCFNKVPIAPYLVGNPKPPAVNEAGWKDTVQTFPGEVTTVVATFKGNWNTTVLEACSTDPNTGLPYCGYHGDALTVAPTTPAPAFLPDTSGPYVWHCHIVDHEDNEMMRPLVLVP